MSTASTPRRPVKPTKRRDSSPVRVYPDGRVAYWTGGKPGTGKRKFERLGSVASAEIWAAAFLLQCQNPDGPSGGHKTDQTLDHLAQAFLEHLRTQGAPEGTVRQYKSNWNTWVPAQVGATECGLARLWTYTAVFDALGKAGAPLGTVRAVGRTLAATIVFGVERGYFGDANPFASPDQRKSVLKRAMDRARKRAEKARRFENENCPTADDVDVFAAAMEEQYPGYGERLVKLDFATGLRLLELLALRWDSLDPLTGVVAVDWQLDRYKPWPALAKPKGGKVRDSRV